jgi:hypothetical protein
MEYLYQFELSLKVDDVLRGEGVEPEVVHAKRPSLLAAAEKALQDGISKLQPRAILQTVDVLEQRHEQILLQGKKKFTGVMVTNHFSGANQIIAVLCTIGPELENEIGQLLSSDPVLALALDGLGNAAVERITQQVCERVGKQAQSKGWMASTPISPGQMGWPVEIGQPQIFSLLDSSRIGVSLTPSWMMIPKKSHTFAIGLGKEMSQTDLCELCSLREKCHYRQI